jgi:hypothetical protein
LFPGKLVLASLFFKNVRNFKLLSRHAYPDIGTGAGVLPVLRQMIVLVLQSQCVFNCINHSDQLG